MRRRTRGKPKKQIYRAAAILLLTGTIIALTVYAGRTLPFAGTHYQAFLRDPPAHAGKRLSLTAVPLVEVGQDYFVVRDAKKLLRVEGDTGRREAGGRISVELEFHGDGGLMLVRSDFHSCRPLKVAVSVLGALFLAGYLVFSYRVDSRGLYLVER